MARHLFRDDMGLLHCQVDPEDPEWERMWAATSQERAGLALCYIETCERLDGSFGHEFHVTRSAPYHAWGPIVIPASPHWHPEQTWLDRFVVDAAHVLRRLD